MRLRTDWTDWTDWMYRADQWRGGSPPPLVPNNNYCVYAGQAAFAAVNTVAGLED